MPAAPSASGFLEYVKLDLLACTLKRQVLQGMRAQWMRLHSNDKVVIMPCCTDKIVIDEKFR